MSTANSKEAAVIERVKKEVNSANCLPVIIFSTYLPRSIIDGLTLCGGWREKQQWILKN